MNTLKLKISSIFSFIILTVMGQQKETNNLNVQTIWEKGVTCFLNEDDKGSILNFEKLLLLIDKKNPKYSAALFYIGHSYRVILKSEGLTSVEADRMFECYTAYLSFPLTIFNVETNKGVEDFLERKKKNRPANNVKKWKDSTD
ncbi:MAG: hypothetical protein ABIP51_04905 [Bacteroidia bacterium]